MFDDATKTTYQPTSTALGIGYGGLLEQVPRLLIPPSFSLQQGKRLVDILVPSAKLEAFGEQVPRFTNIPLFNLQVRPSMPSRYMLLISHRCCIKQLSSSPYVPQSVLQHSPTLCVSKLNNNVVRNIKCRKSKIK